MNISQFIRFIKSKFFLLNIHFRTFQNRRFCYTREPNLAVPVIVNGEGMVMLGEQVSFGLKLAPKLGGGHILLQARSSKSTIDIGNKVYMSNNVSVIAQSGIEIGSNCQIGELVSIYDCDFHELNPTTRNNSSGESSRIRIGNNVWLGSRAIVLKGVCIGDNSVIAAGSIVTNSIPENCLAGGVPARVIRRL